MDKGNILFLKKRGGEMSRDKWKGGRVFGGLRLRLRSGRPIFRGSREIGEVVQGASGCGDRRYWGAWACSRNSTAQQSVKKLGMGTGNGL